MALRRAIVGLLVERLVRLIILLRWLALAIRARVRRGRGWGHIESSFYWDDCVGKVPNTASVVRELESRGHPLSVESVCEEYHDPASGFMVIDYVHGGVGYRAHVRKAVDTGTLLAEGKSPRTSPALHPSIFATFLTVKLEPDGTDLTEIFRASAGPFRDFGAQALCSEAAIPVEDILMGGGITFQPGAHLLIEGPDGAERVPVAQVIRLVRSGVDSENPEGHET